jgi:hypothetical protein
MQYLRLAIVGAGIADGVVFNHVAGAITALIVVGILDLYAIADARAKRKRKIEDELHRQVVETREERAKDERRKRWLQGDEW